MYFSLFYDHRANKSSHSLYIINIKYWFYDLYIYYIQQLIEEKEVSICM